MAVIIMGTLMSTVDMGGSRVVLPYLEQFFESSPDVIVWVSLIWVLVGSSLMLSMGRAADIFGRKRLYSIGFSVFIVGLALCASAQNVIQLIIFRFVQSFGAAMTIAIGPAVLTSAFPANERGKALGIMGAIGGLGLLSGPALGGLCLDLFGWRSFFFLRIPFVVVGLIMVRILLKKEPTKESKEKFDIPGAVTFFLALVCLLFVLTQGQRWGWSSPWIIGLGGLGLLFLVSFFIAEKKVAHPVLDLSIFKNRLFSISVVSHIFLYIANTTVNFAMPFFLIGGLGFTASKAGLLLVTIPALTLLLSPISGKLSDRLGTMVLCGLGFVLSALGIILLRSADMETTTVTVVLYLIIIGVGMGIFVTPNTSAIIGAVPARMLGSASAMVGTLRHIGMSMGLAIAGSVFAASRSSHAVRLTADGIGEKMVGYLSTVSGFQDTITIALIASVIGLLVSLFRGRQVTG